ncbi:MAG: hypothetical protein IJA23_05795 [Clostridia bacterium]|nr:hypothetical protein [Clostridia bacterium]
MKKNKKQEPIKTELTPEELIAEENKYQACKKPIKLGWTIYAIAAAIYLFNGLFAQYQMNQIPIKKPLTDELSGYKDTQAYNDYITEIQKDAISKLTRGEISIDEYNYIIETTKNNKTFEEFLRSLEDDKQVQQIIAKHDEYADEIDRIGKTYSGLSIASLSSVLVASLILAKYRFREMDIEDKRKQRAEAKAAALNDKEMEN